MAATSALGTGVASALSGSARGITDEAQRSGTNTQSYPEIFENVNTAGKIGVAVSASGTALSIVGDKEPGNNRRTFLKIAATGGAVVAGGSLGHDAGVGIQQDWVKKTGGISGKEYYERERQQLFDDASKEIKGIKEDTKRMEAEHQRVMRLIRERQAEEEAAISSSTPSNVETRPSYESAVERLEAEERAKSPQGSSPTR